MTWVYAILIGVVVGLAIGYTAEQVPIAPIFQSVAAALIAMAVTAPAVMLLWFWLLPPPQSGGLGAVSFGLGLPLLGVLFVVPVALHVALGWAGGISPALANHRAIVLGCAGGLCGALPAAWVMAASMRLN
jgi:hypothetical protein